MPRRFRLFAALSLPGALLGTLTLTGAAEAPSPPVDQPAVFKSYCIGCHSVDKSGRMPRLDGLRASPEEWDNILRRMGRRGLTLSETERLAIVKQISRTRGLAPAENAAVDYIHVSPAANREETVPNHGDFRATCVSCHSWAKIASHRRDPENWKAMRDFHLAMFPASLTQSFREINWWDTAVEATDWLGKKLPYETPEWKRWQARRLKLSAAGAWVVAGRQPGRGDYEATMRLTHRGDDEYDLVREVRWADGARETIRGKATLFGGGALRATWAAQGQPVKAAFTIAPPGEGLGDRAAELTGAWTVHREMHKYGTETGGRLRAKAGASTVLRVVPAWVRPGQGKVDVVVTTDGPVPAGWAPKVGDRAVRVVGRQVIDQTHVRFTLDVGAAAKRGTLALGLNPAGRPAGGRADQLVVARGIDYLKITPEKGKARVGGIAVPPDGVAFEAIAMSNGPDGARHTGDDQALGPLQAQWSLDEAWADFEDRDIELVGKLTQNGVFIPSDEGEAKSYTLGKNGQVWVVATVVRPGQPLLKARAYLLVTAPDMVKPIR